MNIYRGRATGLDFDDLMDFLQYVFGMDGREESFTMLLPKLYKDRELTLNSNFVVTEDGKFRSAVGAYPIELNVLGEKLNVTGIGNVATHPSHSKKGYMREAMTMAINAMVESGTDISVLGGQRQRYAYYGYESVGNYTIFSVDHTNIRHYFRDKKLCKLTVKELKEDDRATLDSIYELCQSRPYHATRGRENLFDLLCSWNNKPFALFDGDSFAGYILRENDTICEFLVRDKKYISPAMMALCGDIEVSVPDFETEILEELFKYAEEWRTAQAQNALVLNFEGVISALLKFKASYTALADFTAVFKIEGYRAAENLRISVKDNKASVEKTEDAADYSLSHLEAMQLFFSTGDVLRKNLAPQIAAALPLPLYIYHCDNV